MNLFYFVKYQIVRHTDAMQDSRNVIDKYKGVLLDAIVSDLDANGIELEIAVENLTRDFNMGTIVRSANAFGVRHVHVVGSRQWNKRGAMMTDKYLHIHYYATVEEFLSFNAEKEIIAIDNVENSTDLSSTSLPRRAIFVFGSEGDGLSDDLLSGARTIISIEQFGSTRSLNVGVAAGVVMYEWLRQHKLKRTDT